MSKTLLWALALVMTGLLNSFMWAQGVNAEPAEGECIAGCSFGN